MGDDIVESYLERTIAANSGQAKPGDPMGDYSIKGNTPQFLGQQRLLPGALPKKTHTAPDGLRVVDLVILRR